MRKTKGKYIVEYVGLNNTLEVMFFHHEADARDFCVDLYDTLLIVGSVSRDDFNVYSDLAGEGLLV